MRDYSRDPEAFARDLLGIALQPHQAEAMRAAAGLKTILKGRQAGGTVTIIGKGVWDAYRWPGHLVLITSASDRQVTELGERMAEVTEAAPIARSLTRRTTERLVFSNGSQVVLLPNNPRTIRGFGVRGLLRRRVTRPGVTAFFDECAHAENGDATRRAIEYALATAPPGRRELWLVTTPTTADAWPMRYFALGQEGEPGCWSARWPSDLNAYVDKGWLAERRRLALPAEVCTEIEGRPADAADALFAPLLPGVLDASLPFPAPPHLAGAVGVGVDLHLPYSRGQDSSAAVALARVWTPEGGETWQVLDVWRERHYAERELLAVLGQWQVRYNAATVLVEQYGSTGVIEGALGMHLPVETVAPTAANQAEAFGRLYVLAREDRLRIPAGATALIDELQILRHAIGETGIPRFAAPAGRHDDCAFALAWAARAVGAVPARAWAAGADLPILSGRPSQAAVMAGLVPMRMHFDDVIVTPSDLRSIEKQEAIARLSGSADRSRRCLII
jgi:hypothetical protein